MKHIQLVWVFILPYFIKTVHELQFESTYFYD